MKFRHSLFWAVHYAALVSNVAVIEMSAENGAAAAYHRMAEAMKGRMDDASQQGNADLAAAFEKKYKELLALAKEKEAAAA